MIAPNIFEDLDGNKLYWDVFSRSLKDRIIWVGTEISSVSANVVVAQLLYLHSQDKNKDIQMYINSPGGSISDGMAIYDTMNYISPDVSTICLGMAASMGAFLLSAGTKGKRFALPNSEVLIHQPLGGARGQASDIQIAAEHILRTKKKMNTLLAQHTGQPVERVEKDCDRDYIMSAEEAVAYGLVDSIIEKKENSPSL